MLRRKSDRPWGSRIQPGRGLPEQGSPVNCVFGGQDRGTGRGLDETCGPEPPLPTSRLLSPQLARYTKEGFLHLGALGTTTLLPDTRCLVDNSKSRLPQLLDCDKVKSSLYKRWNFIQVGSPLGRASTPEQVRLLQTPGKSDLPKERCPGKHTKGLQPRASLVNPGHVRGEPAVAGAFHLGRLPGPFGSTRPAGLRQISGGECGRCP